MFIQIPMSHDLELYLNTIMTFIIFTADSKSVINRRYVAEKNFNSFNLLFATVLLIAIGLLVTRRGSVNPHLLTKLRKSFQYNAPDKHSPHRTLSFRNSSVIRLDEYTSLKK